MTVLLQMWVGRQRPRRQEFQKLSAPILGGYVQATTCVLIRSGQPKSRDLAATCPATPATWRYSPTRSVWGRLAWRASIVNMAPAILRGWGAVEWIDRGLAQPLAA